MCHFVNVLLSDLQRITFFGFKRLAIFFTAYLPVPPVLPAILTVKYPPGGGALIYLPDIKYFQPVVIKLKRLL